MAKVGQCGSGGSGVDATPARTSFVPCARNLILTILLSISPLVCALVYQNAQINKANKELETYTQLLEQLNKKENLTKQEKQIKEDLEEKLEDLPNNNTNNNVKPTFNRKPWHKGSNSRRKTR
jgi:hypothetical protein